MLYLCNAFSLSMLDRRDRRTPIPIDDPRRFLEGRDFVSAVGHAETATIFAQILGVPVALNRVSVKLGENDAALIGQYVGPRLPEGATTLPEGARIEWWLI